MSFWTTLDELYLSKPFKSSPIPSQSLKFSKALKVFSQFSIFFTKLGFQKVKSPSRFQVRFQSWGMWEFQPWIHSIHGVPKIPYFFHEIQSKFQGILWFCIGSFNHAFIQSQWSYYTWFDLNSMILMNFTWTHALCLFFMITNYDLRLCMHHEFMNYDVKDALR